MHDTHSQTPTRAVLSFHLPHPDCHQRCHDGRLQTGTNNLLFDVVGRVDSKSVPKEIVMQSRIEYAKTAPAAMTAMMGLETYVRQSGLEGSLIELVKLRASQINGCAYCVDMHTKDARAEGETEQRLYAVVAWEETPFFTERERAALAWTEAVTLVGQGHVPDDIYDQARRSFSERELIDLTLAVIAINGWNRLAISFRTVPGTYQPARKDALRTDTQDSLTEERRARPR
jgi:AhpD family alkylhydroperoxidase